MPTILFAGTRIYLTRAPYLTINIKPGTIVLEDILFVLYDVKIDDCVVIPRGTMVIGDWVTEAYPIPSAQLQLTKMFLCEEFKICADSDIYEAPIDDVIPDVLDLNPVTRVVRLPWRVHMIMDGPLGPYLEIDGKEIPVTLTMDLCLPK